MSEVNNAESSWDTATEERPTAQTGKPSGFASNCDKNAKSGDSRESREPRGFGGDRPSRGGRFEERRGGDRFDDRPPRDDRYDSRPYRGDRYDDLPSRGGRFEERRGGDRLDDRRDYRDRYDDRYDDRRNYPRYDDYKRGDYPEYDRRDRDSGKRDYSDADYPYSRRDRDMWDARRGEPYREKRRRTRQDEAAPNETLGIFALKYDLMQRDFDDFLASRLEKFKDKYSTKLVVDRMTGKCRGYGFVTFDTVENATEAKNLLADGEIMGQPYRVAFSIGERRPSGFQRRTEADVDVSKNEKED